MKEIYKPKYNIKRKGVRTTLDDSSLTLWEKYYKRQMGNKWWKGKKIHKRVYQ